MAQVLHLWRLVNPWDTVATGGGGLGLVPVPAALKVCFAQATSSFLVTWC